MAPSSPLGLFGKLPQEIRYEIYFQALGHVCIAEEGTLLDTEKHKPLSILAVARQISEEASQTLSTRTTLHFDGDAEIFYSTTSTKVANISVTLDPNLGIIFEHSVRANEIYRKISEEGGDGGLDIYMEAVGSNLLDSFTGAGTAREAAYLHFCPIGSDHAVFSRFDDKPPLICSDEKRHNIKLLVGFRKVVMVLEFVVKAGDANLEACNGGGAHRDNGIWDFVLMIIDVNNTDIFDGQDRDYLQSFTTEVGQDFEEDLGAFTTHFVDRPNGDIAGIITYHPRQAHDTINQKAATAEEDSYRP